VDDEEQSTEVAAQHLQHLVVHKDLNVKSAQSILDKRPIQDAASSRFESKLFQSLSTEYWRNSLILVFSIVVRKMVESMLAFEVFV